MKNLARPRRPSVPSPRAWTLVVLSLCAASAATQAALDRRHEGHNRDAEACPIPLDRIPSKIGGWRAKGRAIEVDAKTLLISGCSAHVSRLYSDENTGVILSVLVGFGPADRVAGHAPDVCFPAFGYEPQGTTAEHTVELGSGVPPARLRSAVFVKSDGARSERVEVYYGFRQGGLWAPEGSGKVKRSRRQPGAFKLQVQRPLARGERAGAGSPVESFLGGLIPEIEAAIRKGRPRG